MTPASVRQEIPSAAIPTKRVSAQLRYRGSRFARLVRKRNDPGLNGPEAADGRCETLYFRPHHSASDQLAASVGIAFPALDDLIAAHARYKTLPKLFAVMLTCLPLSDFQCVLPLPDPSASRRILTARISAAGSAAVRPARARAIRSVKGVRCFVSALSAAEWSESFQTRPGPDGCFDRLMLIRDK